MLVCTCFFNTALCAAVVQPFFVGMGTHRPHLPWEFPLEYEIPTPARAAPQNPLPPPDQTTPRGHCFFLSALKSGLLRHAVTVLSALKSGLLC